jgi:predicted Zn-dependent protease
MRRHGTTLLLLAAMVATALPAAAEKVVPITELEKLPANADEAGLWEESRKHEARITEGGELFANAELERYLRAVVDRMLGSSLGALDVDVRFLVVQRPTLSAWVYPYGTIAVTTGLLTGMDNEAQLAAIVGHELAHFIARHSYRELIADRRQSAIGKGLGLLATAAVAAKTGTVDTSLMGVGGIWTDLVTSGYSRELEHVADAEGLRLMRVGGYPLGESVPAFEALRENDVYGALAVMGIWSSHPKLDDRIANLERDVAEERKRIGAGPPVPDPALYDRGVAPALLVNAQLELDARQYARARTALERFLTVHPTHAQASFLVGETLRREFPDGPDLEPRLAAYRRALANDASYAPAARELGLAERQRGEGHAAIAAFERYLALAPDAPDAGIVRGYLSELTGGR